MGRDSDWEAREQSSSSNRVYYIRLRADTVWKGMDSIVSPTPLTKG